MIFIIQKCHITAMSLDVIRAMPSAVVSDRGSFYSIAVAPGFSDFPIRRRLSIFKIKWCSAREILAVMHNPHREGWGFFWFEPSKPSPQKDGE